MKIYSKSITSPLGNLAIDGIDDLSKAEDLRARLSQVRAFNSKLKRLNVALANLVVAEDRTRLARVQQAQEYLDRIKPLTPSGLSVKMIRNELGSIRDGLLLGAVRPTDLAVTGVITLLSEVKTLEAALVNKLEAAEPTGVALDKTESLILKNRKFNDSVPTLSGDKQHGLVRVPVSFSTSFARNQSSVGYLDPAKLDMLGFKSELLDSYAVVYNQVCIGVHRSLVDRGKKPIDAAVQLKSMIEKKSGISWSFIMPTSYPSKNGSWFWVMPDKDASRFAKAFPGGRIHLQSWGFAF